MSARISPASAAAAVDPTPYPENPVLVRVWRGPHVESQHRGSWVVVDERGTVVAGAGEYTAPVFARSSVKSLQALPLLETGAAARYGFDDADLALALASHNAEPCHTERVAAILARLSLGEQDLQCGPQPPGDPATRAELARRGQAPGSLHNNCSGKHAGFLALALHLGVPTARYLDPESAGQRLVREAVLAMCGLQPSELSIAVDGCNAPTFRLPLAGLATAFARVANPEGLPGVRRDACQRMLGAVERFPELIAGRHKRLCTDLARTSRGRLFPKIGGEAVYAIGVRGGRRGLALKVDDGSTRGLHATIIALLERFDFLPPAELDALASWRETPVRNWAGLDVGRLEVLL